VSLGAPPFRATDGERERKRKKVFFFLRDTSEREAPSERSASSDGVRDLFVDL
jgi:hypothetical protein